VAALSGAALCVVPLAATGAQAAPASATIKPVVNVDLNGKVTGGISNHLIGLSFESSTLNNGYRYNDVGNLPQLLDNLGHGIIRFGGNSADTTFTGSTQQEIASVKKLTKATGWSVLYTENLAHFNAKQDAADAKRVYATLGSSLYAFACGNEPDQYAADGLRSASYTVASYLKQVDACYNAIRSGAKKAPLEGPDTAWNPAWLSAFGQKFGAAVTATGQHYYPLGCAKASTSAGAAASALLSSSLASTESAKLGSYVAAAKSAKKPLDITETNSACAGGVKGASNAYASALWVIDYLLLAARDGVNELNFHGGLNTLCSGYTVLCATGNKSYTSQPIYYGMLFTRLFATGSFLPVSVSTPPAGQHIAAFADKPAKTGSIRVMVENMGSAAADTRLELTGYHGTSVKVLRMTGGSSPLDTSGVKIQGAAVSAGGKLTPGAASVVACKSGVCGLTLAPYSAALVTLSAS
jgi:hypothetical protein